MSFVDKIRSFFGTGHPLSEDFFDDLCDLLVEGDFGAAVAMRIVDVLKDRCKKQKINEAGKAKEVLALMLKEMLEKADTFNHFDKSALSVVMLIGVNGVGKTTTAAKLAYLLKKNGKVILAAADTFRAAAIDQLKIHGERLDVRVVAHKQGGDPAAVVFDALQAAISGSYTALIADTAGRMHTKNDLIDELKKIDRVAGNDFGKNVKTRYIKLLLLDATTGTNAINQAETFSSAVHIDGVILTKFDSSAKGGVVFTLAENLHLPVIFLCTGEKYEDMKPFNADYYIRDFLGITT